MAIKMILQAAGDREITRLTRPLSEMGEPARTKIYRVQCQDEGQGGIRIGSPVMNWIGVGDSWKRGAFQRAGRQLPSVIRQNVPENICKRNQPLFVESDPLRSLGDFLCCPSNLFEQPHPKRHAEEQELQTTRWPGVEVQPARVARPPLRHQHREVPEFAP